MLNQSIYYSVSDFVADMQDIDFTDLNSDSDYSDKEISDLANFIEKEINKDEKTI